jgi:hypothetical protein
MDLVKAIKEAKRRQAPWGGYIYLINYMAISGTLLKIGPLDIA